MTGTLLITGGEARPDASRLPEGTRYRRANAVRLDLASGACEVVLSREASLEAYPAELPSVLFGAGTRVGDELYLCTNTELLVYRYPSFDLLRQASYPFFNELHSVTVDEDRLLVASTGMDLAIVLDRATLEPIEIRHALGKDPKVRHDWARQDYRKSHSLKPHDVHPNYVFSIKGELWVTRFNQKDAVSLDQPGRRINIGIERPHDGFVRDNVVHFTTVNGHVVTADTRTLEVAQDIDLNQIEQSRGPLGWCRGLLLDGNVAYVGFSRLRSTPLREHLRWIRDFATGQIRRPTRVVAYDLESRRKLCEYPLPEQHLSALFGILPG